MSGRDFLMILVGVLVAWVLIPMLTGMFAGRAGIKKAKAA